MKKEIIALTVFLLLFAVSLVNIHALTRLTENIVTLVEEADGFVREEDWEKALKSAKGALRKWEDSGAYTHIIIRHTDIDSATDVLSTLIKEIYAEERGSAIGAARAAIARLRNVAATERLKLRNIL